MNNLKRRDLLKGALSAGALGFAGLSSGTVAASTNKRVLVVGAGLSGLYAAMLLEQFGYSVHVVEGRHRIGGRLYTLDDVPGHPEAGGNTIGPNYGRIIDVAQRLNISLSLPGRGLSSSYVVDGTLLSSGEWPDWPGNPLPVDLKKLTPDRISGQYLKDFPFIANADWRNSAYAQHDQSAADFFRSRGLNDRVLQLIDVNNSYGNKLEDTTMLSLYRVFSTFTRAVGMKQSSVMATKGNMRIPESMANSLSAPVVLGQKIVEVEQSSEFVRAISESGEVFEADAIVMTLPVPALRNINFTPQLNPVQKEAIQQVEYHKVTQAHLVTREPFWEVLNQTASYWTNGPLGRVFSRQTPGLDDSYNMTVWINGDACDAFDSLPEDLAREKIIEELNKILPGAKEKVELKKLVSWRNESLNQGAWAAWRPGQIAKYFGALHQPAGKIFFAGEHTSYSYSGMEGAAESGERAAMEVMGALS